MHRKPDESEFVNQVSGGDCTRRSLRRTEQIEETEETKRYLPSRTEPNQTAAERVPLLHP